MNSTRVSLNYVFLHNGRVTVNESKTSLFHHCYNSIIKETIFYNQSYNDLHYLPLVF